MSHFQKLSQNNLSKVGKVGAKDKTYVNVIKHFKSKTTLNENRGNCDLPEVNLNNDEDYAHCYKKISLNPPCLKRKKVIKFSSAPESKKSKYNPSGSLNVKEKKIVQNLSLGLNKTNTNIFSKWSTNKTTLNTGGLKKQRAKKLDKELHQNSPNLSDTLDSSSSFLSSLVSTSTSSIEKEITNTNNLSHIHSLSIKPKNKSVKSSENNIVLKKNVEKITKAIDKTSTMSQICKREIKNKDTTKSIFQTASNIKNFQQESLAKLNEEIRNMNLITRRRIIAELKTEIAEFKKRGIYVFNFNVNNKSGTKRRKHSSILRSKSEGDSSSSSCSPRFTSELGNMAIAKKQQLKPKSRSKSCEYYPSVKQHKLSKKIRKTSKFPPLDFPSYYFENDNMSVPAIMNTWVVLPNVSKDSSGVKTSISICQEEVIGYKACTRQKPIRNSKRIKYSFFFKFG